MESQSLLIRCGKYDNIMDRPSPSEVRNAEST